MFLNEIRHSLVSNPIIFKYKKYILIKNKLIKLLKLNTANST